MAKILEMPKLSPTMEEGVLSAWHKKEGDAVEVDDLLAEVETDKATMEFRAFDKGTMLKLLVDAGETVKLGQPVAILGAPGEDITALVPAQTAATAQRPSAVAPAPPPPPARAPAPAPPRAPSPAPTRAPAPPPAPTGRLDRTEHETAPPPGTTTVLASPYIRKMARDRGLSLQGARGSGPQGRLQPADLEQLRSGNGTPAPSPAPAPTVSDARATPERPALAPQGRDLATTDRGPAGLALCPPEVRPLSMMRKTIARRLTESKQTVPHFYLTIDVDVSELVALRERINVELQGTAAAPDDGRAREGVRAHSHGRTASLAAPPGGPAKVSLTDLLVKACATALTRVPECNAQFAGDAIHVFHRIDISVAVAIPEGLITPVVRNADTKSVVAISRELRDLAARARSKKLSIEEMTQGTFSVSNLGMFGIDRFSAVINPPEGAILAIGRARDEPTVLDGRVVAGKRLAMTLSCDHRVIDGAVGAAFLAELRALVEHPIRVLAG